MASASYKCFEPHYENNPGTISHYAGSLKSESLPFDTSVLGTADGNSFFQMSKLTVIRVSFNDTFRKQRSENEHASWTQGERAFLLTRIVEWNQRVVVEWFDFSFQTCSQDSRSSSRNVHEIVIHAPCRIEHERKRASAFGNVSFGEEGAPRQEQNHADSEHSPSCRSSRRLDRSCSCLLRYRNNVLRERVWKQGDFLFRSERQIVNLFAAGNDWRGMTRVVCETWDDWQPTAPTGSGAGKTNLALKTTTINVVVTRWRSHHFATRKK